MQLLLATGHRDLGSAVTNDRQREIERKMEKAETPTRESHHFFWRLYLKLRNPKFETVTVRPPQYLSLQSVAGDIILRIFNEEPVGRYNSLVTENGGTTHLRWGRLTSTTRRWGLQYPGAKGCGHQSIHAKEGSQVVPNSWPG